jgi:aminomethyltransferase
MLSKISIQATNCFHQSRRLFTTQANVALKKTHLASYHRELLKAKMVPFAGYEMPVVYSEGIIKEHLHTRQHAGIFDVSHMGQLKIVGKDAASFLEKYTVADVHALTDGKATLSLITNENGGVKDDCIITRVNANTYFVVLNAGCKEKDLDHFNYHLNSKE